MGLEEVGSIVLLALGCFLALFVQLGDLGRQLCIGRLGREVTRKGEKVELYEQAGREGAGMGRESGL